MFSVFHFIFSFYQTLIIFTECFIFLSFNALLYSSAGACLFHGGGGKLSSSTCNSCSSMDPSFITLLYLPILLSLFLFLSSGSLFIGCSNQNTYKGYRPPWIFIPFILQLPLRFACWTTHILTYAPMSSGIHFHHSLHKSILLQP